MKIIIALSFLISMPIFAQKKAPFLNKLRCTNSVLGAVSSLGEPKEWKKNLDASVSSDFEGGGSVTIDVEKSKSTLTSNQNGLLLKLDFSEPDCKMKVLKISSSSGGFLDRDLDQLLKKEKRGVIYLWSPHMSLSVYELVEMKKYLSSLKIPVTILLDLNADIDFANKSLQKYDLPLEYLKRMNSRKLENFGATIHYPSTIFYKDGELVKRVPGFNGKKSLQDLIKRYLGEI
ncbi:thioredoxin family protein [Halobacteriovorax marinus]|uniref:thioredoxin family protein n=1 Tax=Halobacteriovorax marinus TaxID=97084 RepID=UPI0012FD2F16|nr:thioredoxin family protein [Halobacteriovorax marinus]